MLPTQNDYEYIVSESTPALNAFFNYALSIASYPNLRIRLTPNEIQDVALSALEVKFWDRIDNLRTTEAYKYPTPYNITKAKRKLQETKDYFFKISQEFDKIKGTDFKMYLFFEVKRLQLFLAEFESSSRVYAIIKK